MKAKNLVILTVVAAALVTAAIISSSRRNKATATTSMMGKPLLPTLQKDEAKANIARIEIQSKTSTISVTQTSTGWVADSKYNYPVEFKALGGLVRKLGELKVGQTVPGGEKQREKLALHPPSTEGPGRTATAVRLLDKEGVTIAGFLAGKQHTAKTAAQHPSLRQFGPQADGRFVAVDDRIYLIADPLQDIPSDVTDWMNKDLANVSSSDIQSIEIVATNGTTLRLARPEPGKDLSLANLAEDEEMDTGKVNSLANVLSWLSFKDVADPKAKDEALGFDKPLVVTAVTADGRTYVLTVGVSPTGSTDRCLRIAATYTQPAAPPEEDDEEARRKQLETQQKLQADIKALSARTAAWTYLVEAYKVESLTTKRADLIKKKEVKKDDEGPDKATTQTTEGISQPITPLAPVKQPEAEPTPAPEE